MVQISLQEIREFSQKYQSVPDNQQLEKRITSLGLEKACIQQKVIEDNPFTFNIELSETKRYDQKDSLKCWIFAGINLIKRNIAQNLGMNDLNFALSDNYISFFDKLEKSNNAYEKVIQSKTMKMKNLCNILEECATECGNFTLFRAIINKYGMVPLSVMPEVPEGCCAEKITLLYQEKIKKDIFQLWEAKKAQRSREELRKKKKQYLEENYQLLAKILRRTQSCF